MKRRTFGIMAGTSLLGAAAGAKPSLADTPPDASLLTTTLTPMGSERAGNAAGTIPAWTGGFTEIPEGVEWDPTKTLPPDFFASDAMLYEVNSSNLAQYADLLSEGLQTLVKNKGFYLKVYPTRRTHALPQWIYDNIAQNVTRTTVQNGDARLGFNGAYGGYPFPILSSDPNQAGAQIMWNHEARWSGPYFFDCSSGYTNANGNPILAVGARVTYRNEYYQPGGSPATFSGNFYSVYLTQFAPATAAGTEALGTNSANPAVHPQDSWILLPGQGRVRRTPTVEFDTPSSYADGIVNYDETAGFNGPLFKYDWKLLGKKEMLIPYNNNSAFAAHGAAAHLPNFFDPNYNRWELHRVWVVEATLHPGERNTLARRIFYVDEDTWTVGVTDAWDGNGDILRLAYLQKVNFPNLPGTIWGNGFGYNLQTSQYVSTGTGFVDPPFNEPFSFSPFPDSLFEPQTMAANSAY